MILRLSFSASILLFNSTKEPYIDSFSGGLNSKTANYCAPICSFDPNNIYSKDIYYEENLLKKRLKLINYLRGKDKGKLTKETFLHFTKTEEYSEL